MAKEVNISIVVARSYEIFEAYFLKVIAELMEEISDSWIVTVAIHNLPGKVILIVLKLSLDVLNLSVKLILFRFLSSLKAGVFVFHSWLILVLSFSLTVMCGHQLECTSDFKRTFQMAAAYG